MNAVFPIREQVIDNGVAAQCLNAEQHRLSLRQTELVMQAAGLVRRLSRTRLTREQQAMVDEAAGLLREFWDSENQQRESNEAERDYERAICGHAERLGREPWTIATISRAVSDPLASLLNPIVTGTRKQEAQERVLAVIDDVIAAGKGDLLRATNASLSRWLRPKKFTLLIELVEARKASLA